MLFNSVPDDAAVVAKNIIYNVLAISLKGLTSLISTFIGPKKFVMVSLSGASIMKYPFMVRAFIHLIAHVRPLVHVA